MERVAEGISNTLDCPLTPVPLVIQVFVNSRVQLPIEKADQLLLNLPIITIVISQTASKDAIEEGDDPVPFPIWINVVDHYVSLIRGRGATKANGDTLAKLVLEIQCMKSRKSLWGSEINKCGCARLRKGCQCRGYEGE